MKKALPRVCGVISLLLAVTCTACVAMPKYPPEAQHTAKLFAAARQEGALTVYSVLSNDAAKPLVADFEALYPGIVVSYDGESGSNEMEERFRRELAEHGASADVVWSSATDRQMQLVLDGYALTYKSPEAVKLPSWANYRDQAWGTTLEPVVFAYNRKLLTGSDIPTSHADLLVKLTANPDRYRARVTGFDVAKSNVGYMFAARDKQVNPSNDALLDAFGHAEFTPGAGTGAMLVGIQSGKYLLGYNIMGAYALSRSRKDLPDLAVVFPSDYTLLLSRVAFVSKSARHPNAARLWIDYLLSARGQAVLANNVKLFPVREDANATLSASELLAKLGGSALPIPLDVSVTEMLGPEARSAYIADWQARTGAGQE